MDIKYIGENALQYIINKCKETFASLTHSHTASEVGADEVGSAAAALSLAEQYTNEQVSLKASQTEFDSHVSDSNIHFTDTERTKLSNIEENANYYVHPKKTIPPDNEVALYKFNFDSLGHADNADYVEKADLIALGVADQVTVTEHIEDNIKHISSTERTNWNESYTHSQSAHVTQAQVDELSAEAVRLNEEGNINMADESSDIKNWLPLAVDDSGNIYNGTGYKNGYRWSSSANGETTVNGNYGITGYIPCKYLDTIRLKNVTAANSSTPYIVCFNSSKALIGLQTISTALAPNNEGVYTIVLNVQPNTAFVRLSFCSFTSESVVTINQDFNLTGSASYGWLVNENGDKISPRVLIDYVTTPNGSTINDLIETASDIVLESSKNYTDSKVITVDSNLSTSSTNPVENQAITNWLAENVKQYKLIVNTGNSGYAYLSNEDVNVVADAPTDDSDASTSYTIYSLRAHVNGEETDVLLGTNWSSIKDIPFATTSSEGIVQLTDSTSSTSTSTAATPNSVKSAYDLANTANTTANNAQATADSKADLNHVHSYNDLTDRTHYIGELTKSTVFTEADISFSTSGNLSSGSTSVSFGLVVGDTYTVIFDGVEYIATVSQDSFQGSSWSGTSSTVNFIRLGAEITSISTSGFLASSSISTCDFAKYPFCITITSSTTSSTMKVYSSSDNAGTHTLEIQKHNESIVQLEEKFIPDTIARTSYVDENYALKTDLENIDLSIYETEENAQLKLDEAKDYTDTHNTSTSAHSDIRENIATLQTELQEQLNLKLTYNNAGTVGQFAISDGAGGVTWLTVTNGNEVAY